MGTYTAQPSPTPTGSYTQTAVSPQPAPAPAYNSGATDWNKQWNDIWNQAWNAGYNKGSKPSVDSSFQSAVGQGYSAGLSEWNKRQPTGSTQSGTTNFSTNTNQSNPTSSYEDEIRKQQEALRSEISGGYDSYFASLDEMLNSSLPSQFANQNQIIQSNLQSNLSDLNAQNTMGLGDLQRESDKNQIAQVKSLKDISSNIRNLMNAGNTYLGGRGAGDSSAVNQYSYALTKLGSKQRGDVLSQTRQIEDEIANRKFKFGTAYNNEVNRLNYESQTKGLEVLNWFIGEQDRIRQMKAQGNLSKSQDLAGLTTQLYNQAVSKLQNYLGEVAQKRASLETWAMNNSRTTAELMANLKQVSNYMAQNPTYSGINGSMYMGDGSRMSANGFTGGGTGGYYADDEDLFS